MNATDDSVSASSRLSKSLLARHLVMISIGGIIGGGVFVGSSGAIANIGPAVLLSYISAGIVVFGVITILARMAMDRPGLGSFTEYVRVALGDGAGFITGWLYWWFWVVVVAFEALVGAQTAQAWLPQFEVWQIGLGLMPDRALHEVPRHPDDRMQRPAGRHRESSLRFRAALPVLREEAEAPRGRRGLAARPHAELAQDGRDMMVDRFAELLGVKAAEQSRATRRRPTPS